MGKKRSPRHGSMQFWPRVRAKKETARVRSPNVGAEAKLCEFAGYKAGMTQVTFVDPRKTSLTKGQTVTQAVTIIECPPVQIIAVRFYKQEMDGLQCVGQVNATKVMTDVQKRLVLPKEAKEGSFDSVKEYDSVRLVVATQPKLCGFAKKVADIFEAQLGGDKDSQLSYAKEKLGTMVAATDVLSAGDVVDSHAVTTGRGYQGPVKRFGVNLRASKSEKTKRGPGSLGGWKAQGHVMYRIAYAGDMGYHLRTDYNKQVLLLGDDASKVNPVSGLTRYGVVKSSFILIKGSVSGTKKRLIRLTKANRVYRKSVRGAVVDQISVVSQ
ncbi:MAG: large subunit ribosomal protein L3 [Candidatus Woesearchaeota archaeon]|jgi:large subunit ribosomal protein L3